MISEEVLISDSDKLDKCIWDIIIQYISNYPFLKDNFKREGTIHQIFEKLNNNDIYCFKYLSNEECSF